jgi:hypothetical protein
MRKLLLFLIALASIAFGVCSPAQPAHADCVAIPGIPPSGTGCAYSYPPTVSGGCSAVLALDGSGQSNTSTTTVSATITTTNTNDLIVAIVDDPGGTPTIADTSSLTWTARTGSPFSGGGHTTYVWTAPSSGTLSSDTITVTAAATFHTLNVFGISGSNTSSPFDGSLQQASPDPVSITTTNANDFVYAHSNSGSSSPSPGTGLTNIVSGNFAASFYAIFSATQSAVSVGENPNGGSHLMLADAVKRSC